MRSALFQFAQHCKRLTPLLAAPAALVLCQGQAKADLTYNIYESIDGNVIAWASGSLDFTGATSTGTNNCGYNGALYSAVAGICTGADATGLQYHISGSSSYNGTVMALGADSLAGIFTALNGSSNTFIIDTAYNNTDPILSAAKFENTTLTDLGFTISSGLLGSWTLTGTSEKIYACLGTDPCAPAPSVPGPLPLLGAGAAFGWSRRLRRRIATPLITPPRA